MESDGFNLLSAQLMSFFSDSIRNPFIGATKAMPWGLNRRRNSEGQTGAGLQLRDRVVSGIRNPAVGSVEDEAVGVNRHEQGMGSWTPGREGLPSIV